MTLPPKKMVLLLLGWDFRRATGGFGFGTGTNAGDGFVLHTRAIKGPERSIKKLGRTSATASDSSTMTD